MKSFTAILDEALQTPHVNHGREFRLAGGIFLPTDDAPPPVRGSAAKRTQALYRELMDDTDPAPEPARPAPPRLRRREPQAHPQADPQVDLEALKPRVAAAGSQTELAALRRDFARRHHPDLAPADRVEASARAMREANALIDAAARRLG